MLRLWDEGEEIEKHWKEIPAERFAETVTSFGAYAGPGHGQILYVIDNEIHHRGQGYVYLRALGVEPPPFYAR
ncbi:MAG TPA: DinB family protein [Longimicrobiales bacterium]|nr:DinB family protein [Longimicrobiales bacterium]